jgi:flagellar motor switch protein FliG
MRQLTQDEIESLTVEITNVRGVSSSAIDHVIEAFHEIITAQE